MNGQEYQELKDEEVKDIGCDIFLHGVVRILPEGWLYPALSVKYLDKIQTMKFRSDDVIVTTFPKCGTTWMQEILWTMLHNPNLDNPKANEDLWLRSPEISIDMMFDLKPLKGVPTDSYMKKFNEMCPGKRWEDGLSLHLAEAEASPRILKSHYPVSLLPHDILDKTKVVYVARNPKDMAVSLFYFFKTLNVFPFDTSMEGLFEALMVEKSLYGPFWPHVKEAWQKRHHPNLHFVFYEDMKADIMLELRKLNEFLGTQKSEETLEAVARHTSFSAMKSRGEPIKDKVFEKKSDSDVTFFRKGKIGDWRNHFSPEMQKKMDQWSEKNLEGSDLSLSWALAQ